MAAVAVDDKVASNPAVIKAQEDLEQAKASEVAAKSALEALESEGGDEGAIEKARKVLKGAGKKVAKAEKNLKFKIKKAGGVKFGESGSGKKSKNNKKKKDGGNNAKGKGKAAKPAIVDNTPPGEKKDTSKPMPDAYDPPYVEAAWGAWWEKRGFYKANAERAKTLDDSEKFVIVIPPPNVTGSLHLGHALTCSIEDALVRWHRMQGKEVLWLPGTDHAGIATQTVVEKKLAKEQKLTRHDLGREKFLEKVWSWKEQYGGRITTQLRRLGASVDWSREVFTMDPRLSTSVTEAFVRMHEEKLIYRDTRLVNWCSALNTAISDIEVDHLDLEGSTMISVPGHSKDKKYEFGVITSFAYKVADTDGDDELVVATTRLETMLGDTAVAVHPDDPRYKHLHGKSLLHPFRDDSHPHRRIPIVLDGELVDMAFGTGAVKITPAHDPNDFACGRRHGLTEISIFGDKGDVNEEGGEKFKGMMRFDARIAIEEELKTLGLYRGKEDNKMQLPLCSRSKDVIEPRLKPQWWVSTKEMSKDAAQCVRDGKLRIIPDFHKDTWYRWLDDCRDWCISRQLWWGHRIPAYLVYQEGAEPPDPNDHEKWVVARTKEEALAKAAAKLGVDESSLRLEQDPDVLDTWFSSGLFPFSTMGWPNEGADDLEAFFPGALLETGHDILFFWVARMVMMSRTLTGKLPFKEVYLHAMVRDKYGRKMSKSLGNVIDPLEVIEGCTLQQLHEKLLKGNLPEKEVKKAQEGQKADYPNGLPQCGSDALRFGLLAYTVQGRDVNLDIQRVLGYRRFCNKLWNIFKFASMLGVDASKGLKFPADIEVSVLSLQLSERDRWILSRLARTAEAVNAAMTAYIFGDACTAIFNFFIKDLAGVYVELVKPLLRSTTAEDEEGRRAAIACMYISLDMGLRLVHPIMPYISEELWQRLPRREDGVEPESISLAAYPGDKKNQHVKDYVNEEVEARIEAVLAVISASQSLRGNYLTGKNAKAKPDVFIVCTDDSDPRKDWIAKNAADVQTLAGVKSASVVTSVEDVPAGCASNFIDEKIQVHMMLSGIVDFQSEVSSLEKKLAQAEAFKAKLMKKRDNKYYAERVPIEVQEKESEKISEKDAEVAEISKTIEMFKKLSA